MKGNREQGTGNRKLFVIDGEMGRSFIPFSFLLLTLIFLSSCGGSSITEKKIAQDRAAANSETGLTFNDVILEQAEQQGRPLWKIKAKQARYSKDKKIAQIDTPTGDLFQDGKVVLKVTAQSGEYREGEQKILLRGNIIATDPRNGAVLKANELEWQPKKDVLIAYNNLTGSNEKMQLSAKEGRYFTRLQQMELVGQVVGISKDPDIQVKTENAVWQIDKQKIISNQRIQINQYKQQKLTGQAVGNWAEVNLKTKTAMLRQNVQMNSVEPPVKLIGDAVNWNLNTQIAETDRPVTITHLAKQLTLTGNRGRVDLAKQVAYLNGNVRGIGTKNQLQVAANQITWYMPTEEFEAKGNVFYRQADPPFNLTGSRATGKLQDANTIVVTGDSGKRVVTEIIPNTLPLESKR